MVLTLVDLGHVLARRLRAHIGCLRRRKQEIRGQSNKGGSKAFVWLSNTFP
jgi:hypothetical protein